MNVQKFFFVVTACCASYASADVCLAKQNNNVLNKIIQFSCSKPELIKPVIDRANKGEAELQTSLGLYYRGCGNEQEAIRWLKMSAGNKEPNGMIFLGMSYAQGMGVEKDNKRACQLFKNALTQNKKTEYAPLAELKLAECHHHGTGVEVNRPYAEKLLRSSSKHLPVAKFYLALTLLSKEEGFTYNEKEAVRLLKEASRDGSSSASYILSQLYLHGKGVQKNEAESQKYLKLAEKQNAEAPDKILEQLKK